MSFIEQINKHQYLYLTDIGEPEENILKLVVEEAKVSEDIEHIKIGETVITDCSPIVSDDTCHVYEIIFKSYIAYTVLNESYVGFEESAIRTGGLFCVYAKSAFLEYIRNATFASEDYPGKFTHYGINCLDHIVEVVSVDEPEIAILRSP